MQPAPHSSAKTPKGALLSLKPAVKTALGGAASLESLLHLEAAGRNSLQQAEERERYNNAYDRIYPLIRNKDINFHGIADESDLVERRVRECLLYRLSSGKVMQLFGLIPGRCYICRKTTSVGSKEPVCLDCLESIIEAVEVIHPLLKDPPSLTEGLAVAPAPGTGPEKKSPPDTPGEQEVTGLNSLLPDIPTAGEGRVAYPEPPGALFNAEDWAGSDPLFYADATDGNNPQTEASQQKHAQAMDIIELLLKPDHDLAAFAQQPTSTGISAMAFNTQGTLRHYGFKRAFS
ncbi:MAG: hypothetical protein AB7P76_01020 [Candidatus Melainabacteria bacterium]